MRNKNSIYIGVATVLILLVPLIAMQFTNEVVWSLFDFVFAGTLLYGTGLLYELVARRGGGVAYRVGIAMALVAALLLIWVNGAVGIIGNEGNPANLLYIGVLLIGFFGTVIARLKPRGMSYALFATALAQAFVPILALVAWSPETVSLTPGVLGVFVLNGFFVVLFVGSGVLFRFSQDSVA